jgi:ribosomal protein S27E
MGVFDRVRRKQAEAEERNRRLAGFGDAVIDTGEAAARAVQILRGKCPNCGTVNQTESTLSVTQVSCAVCQTTVTVS